MPVVNYLWDTDEDNIVEEFDDAGTSIADYTTEPDLFGNVISQRREGQSSFFHYDAVGSTLAVTDQHQTVTDTRAYTAFGGTTESNGNTYFPFQFVGQKGYYYGSATAGQYAIRRRIYESSSQRWHSVDPLDIIAIASNVYGYVDNSPTMANDPSGLHRQIRSDAIAKLLSSLSPWAVQIPSTFPSTFFPFTRIVHTPARDRGLGCLPTWLYTQTIRFPARPFLPKPTNFVLQFQQFCFSYIQWLDKSCTPQAPKTRVIIDFLIFLPGRGISSTIDVHALLGVDNTNVCAFFQQVFCVAGIARDRSKFFEKPPEAGGTIHDATFEQALRVFWLLLSGPIGVYTDTYIHVNPSKCDCLPDCIPCVSILNTSGVDTTIGVAIPE
jgi:RHS repeat-associated protein